MKIAILIISSCLLLAGCKTTTDTNDNQEVLDEITRLISLTSLEKPADFEKLEGMLEDDHAKDELHEIEAMVKYKEYLHATHGLNFMASFIKSGKETLCPAHALAHYYVFMKHGEDDLAEEGLEEAKNQVEEWVPAAKEFNEKYPSGQSVGELSQRINSYLESIDKGNSTITDDEINALANNGICVEE